MNIIAFETCFGISSVCLYNGNILEDVDILKNNHSNFLPQATEKLLKKADIKVRDLDAVVVNHGPGAFTGVRAGIAFAKGMSFFDSIPMYGVSTLECFVTAKPKEQTAVAVQALKRHVYFQIFSEFGLAITEALHIPIEEIPLVENLITVGINLPNETQHYTQMPSAKKLIERFLFQKPALYTEPLYIRPVNAVIPQNMKIIK
jgi:tRNA threonylcarbamoyl adenosine modification protein YeaZ